MKLAAVDIGSNAIRLQISTALDAHPSFLFKKLEYVRFPLRLGHDVFSTGRISAKSIEKFRKLMRTFQLLLELYEVDDFMFCATSAMRESENGVELVEAVKNDLGITIHVIDGDREAELVNRAISSFLTDRTYLHIDVGGGSTELNLYTAGEKIRSRSFRIGSVRMLEHRDSPAIWKEMEKWVHENVKRSYGKVTAVGTGGNISKIFDLAQKRPGKTISLKKVKEIRAMIEKLSLEERIYRLQMNPDRADVIVPAAEIYTQVMKWARASSILVPDVGLKDGIILYLYEHRASKIKQ